MDAHELSREAERPDEAVLPNVGSAPKLLSDHGRCPRARGRRPRVFLIDRDAPTRAPLAALLEEGGFAVSAPSAQESELEALRRVAPDALLVDIPAPEASDFEMVHRARALFPELVIIVATALGERETGARAIAEGADDYFAAPVPFDELTVVLHHALDRVRLRRMARALRLRPHSPSAGTWLLGDSPAMRKVHRCIEQVAPSRATVLLTGESGTGKELAAQAIHELSARTGAPFVKVQCSALADSLLESELFGHERGAFTGAQTRHAGHFERANGGTLFLDEIGEMPLATQVKLLRFLQERTFERVGGTETLSVDVRIVAATNRSLRAEVAAGRFREDLFYRVDVVEIEMPPLRARDGDVVPLAQHFLARFARENGKSISSFDARATERITRHAWPGNVRELENAIERAVVVCEGMQVGADDLPVAADLGSLHVPGATLKDIERHAILATLEATGGSTALAAKVLGISTRKMQYRAHEYGVLLRGASKKKPHDGGNGHDEARARP